uniref:coiled-coil domain-containing protein 66 isoform X2 n=1 Tax=Myxine glutinosa TaxID=7769 RepID=UPI0035902D66
MDIGDDLMLEVCLHDGKPQLLISSSGQSMKRKLTTKSIHDNNESLAAKTQGKKDVPNADAERTCTTRLAALHDRMCKSKVNRCPFQNGQHVNGTRLNVGLRTINKASQVTESGLGSRAEAQERRQSSRGKPKSAKSTASQPNENKLSKAMPRLEQQNALSSTVGKSRFKHNDHIRGAGIAVASGARERLQVIQKRKSGRVMKDLDSRSNAVNNVLAKEKATNNPDDQVAEKLLEQRSLRTQSPVKAESQDAHLNPPLAINHQTILLNQGQTTRVQDNAQNVTSNDTQEAYGGLWNMIGERMTMKDKLQSNRAQWIRELDEQVQLKRQQRQKEMCAQQNVEGLDSWWSGDRVPSHKKQTLFHDEAVLENRDPVQQPEVILENTASLEPPEADVGSGCNHGASVDIRAVERQRWLEELNRQRDEAQLRRAQERRHRYADSDHSQFEKHFDSFRSKPLPLLGQSQLGQHTDCSRSTEPVQSRFVATVSDTTRPVQKLIASQPKSSYSRSTAVLLDPAQLEELKRNRMKKLQHQQALAEQMEERQKRRLAEADLRRREEEEEERRIAQEHCILQRQRQDEFERKLQQEEQLRRQIEQQHESLHRAQELALQTRRGLGAFQNDHGGHGTGDPQHILTECRIKGREESSLTSSLSVEKSVQTEEGEARAPPQEGPIAARKPVRTSRALGGSRPTSDRATPRVREQLGPTGHRVNKTGSVQKEPRSARGQKPLRATRGSATQIISGREHSDKMTESSTVRSTRSLRTAAPPTTCSTLNKLRVQGIECGLKPPAAEGRPTSSSGGSRKGPPGAVGVRGPPSCADQRPLNSAAHREIVFSNLTRLRKGLQQKRNELEKGLPLHHLPGTGKVPS